MGDVFFVGKGADGVGWEWALTSSKTVHFVVLDLLARVAAHSLFGVIIIIALYFIYFIYLEFHMDLHYWVKNVEQKVLLEETMRELEHKTELLVNAREQIASLEEGGEGGDLFKDLSQRCLFCFFQVT